MKGLFSNLKQKTGYNYCYFGFFFLILLIVNFFHLTSSVTPLNGSSIFFFFCNVGQSLVTVFFLMFLGVLIKPKISKKFYYLYVALVFIFLFSLAIESLLVLLMDLCFSEGVSIAFGADLENFFELLYLADIGIWAWIAFFFVTICIPFLGIAFYKWGEKFQKKHPHTVQKSSLVKGVLFSLGFLLTLDLFFSHFITSLDFEKYKKTLPWKGNFLKTNTNYIFLKKPVFTKKTKEDLSYIPAVAKTSSFLPNIYLFVVESLRDDYVNTITAPNLVEFKNKYISATTALANSNYTHGSWFSLFHSIYPFYWSYKKTAQFNKGSIPLNILKEMGYKVHLYSAAQLRFYHFDEVILGENRKLADTYKLFPHYANQTASMSDQKAIDAFMGDSTTHEKEGNVYLIFLDSTHFNYSWPEDFPEKFTPFDEITWKHRLSNDLVVLESLKNRYRNSISFIDVLFKQTMDHLKEISHYEDSIVVFCGDHGEEFKEEGKLFHASHLNDMQVKIPLFYKFGNIHKTIAITSHVDVFTSILDYLTHDSNLIKNFDGYSVFSDNKPEFAIAARYNASFSPYKFMIYNGKSEAVFRFSDKDNLDSSTYLKVLSELKEEDKVLYEEIVYQAFSKKH